MNIRCIYLSEGVIKDDQKFEFNYEEKIKIPNMEDSVLFITLIENDNTKLVGYGTPTDLKKHSSFSKVSISKQFISFKVKHTHFKTIDAVDVDIWK